MSAALALGGWMAALLALMLAGAGRRTLRRRMELIARAGHDLRGALAGARMGVEAVAGGQGGEPDARRLQMIDLELDRAILALDDLAASREGRRAPDRRHAVDVDALLRQAAAAWHPLARSCDTEVRVAGPSVRAVVHGDRVRLLQACANLIGNALEHGDGPVRLRAVPVPDGVRIEVCDGGPGLPASVAELTRRPRAGRGRRGRGLAIAAEIAARHGGRLAAAPAARGARLTLELPAARVARDSSRDEAVRRGRRARRRPRVLAPLNPGGNGA